MIRSTRVTLIGGSLIIAVILIMALTSSLHTSLAAGSPSRALLPAHTHLAQSYLPLSSFHLRGLDGPYHTQDNLILGADNRPYLFHGVGRDGLEFDCAGDGHFDEQELSYMGLGNNRAHATYWGANVVRLPLSEAFWLNGDSTQKCSAAQYHALVKQTVDTLNKLDLNVILDLQWTDAGGQLGGAGAEWAMPDIDSVTFWQQVAPIYANYSSVLFELYNEPHPASWDCWLNGCQVTNDQLPNLPTISYQAIGMQTLLNTVRNAGANNLALVAGTHWGYSLSQLPSYQLQGTNIVYDTHPYSYQDKNPATWDASFGNLSAIYPVISAENGEYDCGTSYMDPLLTYFDAHDIGWVAWSWIGNGDACRYPRLINDYNGTPTPGMGQMIYQRLQGYLTLLAQQEIPSKTKQS